MSISNNYAKKRIKDALLISNGNYATAQRLILSWLKDDSLLLRELAIPHFKSMVGYALQEYGQEIEAKNLKKTNLLSKVQEQDTKNNDIDNFGQAMLQNMSSSGSMQNFGFTSDSELTPPAKTSKRHVNAIMKIAKKKKAK